MSAKYISTRLILYLSEGLVWRTGAWVSQRWWEQEGLELEEEREREAAMADGEEDKRGKEAAQEETTCRS